MNISEIDFSEYEPVLESAPLNATPREFVLWATGRNYEELKDFVTGIDFTWEELKRMGAEEIVMRLIHFFPGRPIKFRKRTEQW